MTHSQKGYGEQYFSFVNGQHTTQGGTHQAAFREAVVKTVREFYGKILMLLIYAKNSSSS